MKKIKKIVSGFIQLNPFINLLAFMVAIITIFFALHQTKDIENLKNFITTRSIKPFPENLSEINDFLAKNVDNKYKKQVIICVDFPGYGFYSDNKMFKDYFEKNIQQLITRSNANDYEFIYVCYDSQRIEEFTGKQFVKDSISNLRNEKFDKVLTEIGVKEKTIDSIFMDKSSFIKYLVKQHSGLRDAMVSWATKINNSKIFGYTEQLPCFVWYCDGEAIISFPNMENIEEHAIFTRDSKLIEFFLGRIGFERDETSTLFKTREKCQKFVLAD